MAFKLDKKRVSSKEIKKMATAGSSRKTVSGLPINKEANPAQYNIQKAAASLKVSATTPPASTGIVGTAPQAQSMFEILGCTVEMGGREFSLLGTQTDTETVDNKNMIDLNELSKIENKGMIPSKAIPSISNTFWELDEAIAQKDKQRVVATKEQSTGLTSLAGDLAAYNLEYSTTKSLKYFTYQKK